MHSRLLGKPFTPRRVGSSNHHFVCYEKMGSSKPLTLRILGSRVESLVSDNYQEHLHRCSVCDPAQKNSIKKVQHMPVWLRKMGFGSAASSLYWLLWLVKLTAALFTCWKECNKYDLTTTQCFWLAHHNDWSRWFAISSPPLIFAVPVSVFWVVGLQKRT
jgi:hypothetical protein